MSTVLRGTAEAEAARRALERQVADEQPRPAPSPLTAAQLRGLCQELGAHDVGFVDVERPSLGTQGDAAEGLLPGARTLVSLVIATNRDNLMAPPRSVANSAFHHDGERLAVVAYDIARALHRIGVKPLRGRLPCGGHLPDRRLRLLRLSQPQLPRFLGGFADWADTLAEADSADEYRTKFREDETVSLWQSLGFGPQYKSAYCMAVCPAGEDVIGPYLRDRRGYVATHLRPLRTRPEPVYVQSGTRAERVAARNPAKQLRYIDYEVGLASVDNTLRGLQHMFDGTRADLDGTTILCIIDDGTTTHERVLAVDNGSLRLLEPDAEPAPPAATARGPLSAWMDLLVHATAGNPTPSHGLTVTGTTATFDTLVRALH